MTLLPGNGDHPQDTMSGQMSQRWPPAGDVGEGSADPDDRISSKVYLMEHPQPLSDSENEEPGRTPYRSAFVSKNNASCFPSLTWSIQSKLERSQSCIDPVNDAPPPPPPPTRRRAAQSQKTKVPVPPNISSLAAVTGVLLSTENSRSFSAPVLTSERRLAISSLNSFTPLHKPERSISPESNDSISEELNHFKPIVCSPCTPPKRLPDGRVLSPVIIKSTPRNLRRNLQKPTSYEASPMILKKWEQVFQDRQMKRTLSKGTLTTCVEDGPSVKKQETASKGRVACQITFSDVEPAGDVELPPSCSREDASQANRDTKEQSMPCGDCVRSTGPSAEPVIFQGFTEATANSQVGTKTRLATRLTSGKKTISSCKCLVAKPMKASLKRVHKKTSQSMGMQNGSCFSTTEAISLAFPPRRGLKRRCKTKHLEQNGGLKRLRVAGQGGFERRRIWRGAEKKLHQEEEDKKLAVKLQQIFDKESRRANRKSSRDEYHLRSKSTAGAN